MLHSIGKNQIVKESKRKETNSNIEGYFSLQKSY